VSDWDSWPY